MSKKEVLDKKSDDQGDLPVDEKEDSQSIGEIRINHSVIADIVTLSTTKTDGVLMVGKQGFANGIASFFSNKKQNGRGVSISEDEFGNYIIDVSVTLKFGCELAKVASEIQQNIVRDIKRMTTNGVRKVNVFVERVESMDESTESEGQECIE